MSTYTIKWGDTLSGIAQKNNTDVNTLMQLNPYITNANKIYAGKTLNLPGQPVPQTKPPMQQPKPQPTAQTQSAPIVPQKTTQQLAEEYAKQQTANASNDTQALLAQYEKIAEQQKQALQQQQQLTNNQINAQRDNVMQVYNDNARQAYINSMLGKKNVEQQLSQAGLNTSGLLGSAYANVENSYGNNLALLQANRDNSVNEINKQLNDAQLEYAIKESQLLSDIENSKLELQKYGNQLAYQKYQDALNNYMNFAGLDYKKDRDNISDKQWQQEFDYNKWLDDRNYNYQVNRDNIADSQWKQEFELAKKKASSVARSGSSSSRSSSSSSGRYRIEDFTDNENNNDVITDKAREWYDSMLGIEQSRGHKSSEEELSIGIAQALQQGAISEEDVEGILRLAGY